jgi:hypothetical protein
MKWPPWVISRYSSSGIMALINAMTVLLFLCKKWTTSISIYKKQEWGWTLELCASQHVVGYFWQTTEYLIVLCKYTLLALFYYLLLSTTFPNLTRNQMPTRLVGSQHPASHRIVHASISQSWSATFNILSNNGVAVPMPHTCVFQWLLQKNQRRLTVETDYHTGP